MNKLKNFVIILLIAILSILIYKSTFFLLIYLASSDLIEFHLMARNIFTLDNYIITLNGITNNPINLKYIFINWFGNIFIYFSMIKFLKFIAQILNCKINENNRVSYNFSNYAQNFSLLIICFYFIESLTYVSKPFSFSSILLIVKLFLILFFLYFEFILLKYQNFENFNNEVDGVNKIEKWFFNLKYYNLKIKLGKLEYVFNLHFYNLWFLVFLLLLEIPFFLGGKNHNLISLIFAIIIILTYWIYFKNNSFKNIQNLYGNYLTLIKISESNQLEIENNLVYDTVFYFFQNSKLQVVFFVTTFILVIIFKIEFCLLFALPILVYFAVNFLNPKLAISLLLFNWVIITSSLLFLLIIFPKPLFFQNNFHLSILDKNASVLYQDNKENKKGIIPLDPNLLDDSIKEYIKLEDKGFFYQNELLPNINNWHGISLKSLNLFSIGGGSNINAQTIKNLSNISEKDVSRKIVEQISAISLSSRFRNDEILSLYLNNINFYGGGYGTGLALASNEYLGKSFNEMNDLEKYFTFKAIQWQKFNKLFKNSKTLKENGFVYNDDINYNYNYLKKDNFMLIENYLKAYIKQNNGFSLKDSLVQNILNQKINRTEKKHNLSTFFDYFFLKKDKLNNQNAYISSINNDNSIKIDTAVIKFNKKLKTKFGDNVLCPDSINKLYYTSIIVDIKKGKIIGNYSNSITNNLIFLKNPVGSTIKPLLLAYYLEKNNLNPDSFFIRDDEHCIDGKCIDLKTIIGASANNHPFGNNQNTIKSFDKKIVSLLFEKVNGNTDYYKNIDQLSSYSNNNYYLGQSIELNLLNLAQLYQALLNEGKFVRLTPFEYIYNPYDFSRKEYFNHNFSMNSTQFFQSFYAQKVKKAMRGTFDILPNSKKRHGTQHFLLNLLKPNNIYYGKSGTTSEENGAQYGYSIIATDEILVVSKVFYGNPNESKIKNQQNKSIPSGFGSTSAGYLSTFIINEFIQ